MRVVVDGNRITGGSVTAGLDFGLIIIDQLWSTERAELLQLGIDYNPKPPFNSGSPDTARPEIVNEARQMLAQMTKSRMDIAR